MIDIDLIDARRVHRRDGPRHACSRMRSASTSRRSARQQLGVAQPAHPVGRIKNHRCRHDAAKQRSAPHFVHARHQPRTRCPCLLSHSAACSAASSAAAAWLRRARGFASDFVQTTTSSQRLGVVHHLLRRRRIRASVVSHSGLCGALARRGPVASPHEGNASAVTIVGLRPYIARSDMYW